MSFNSHEVRVRDESLPLSRRAGELSGCVDTFNLFEFQSTRRRLQAMVGASDRDWTSSQLLEALNHLEAAKESWHAVELAQTAHQAELKRMGTPLPGNFVEIARLTWLEDYLSGELAATWQVADLGTCEQCSHALIHHGSRCRACMADPEKQGDVLGGVPNAWCTQPLPPP